MTLLKIDSREPEDMKHQMVSEVDDSDVISDYEIVELETADFVCQSIGVERKEGSDFAASVQDRRISEQADRMTERFEHRYVVLEGHPFNLKYTDIGDRSMIGQQVSLCAKRDIRQVTTDDIEGTAYAVRRIVERSLQDESVGHVKTADVETDNVQVAMLAQIQGISKEKAQLIVSHEDFVSMGSLHVDGKHVRHNDLQAWLEEIDGIGPKLAGRVIEAFN